MHFACIQSSRGSLATAAYGVLKHLGYLGRQVSSTCWFLPSFVVQEPFGPRLYRVKLIILKHDAVQLLRSLWILSWLCLDFHWHALTGFECAVRVDQRIPFLIYQEFWVDFRFAGAVPLRQQTIERCCFGVLLCGSRILNLSAGCWILSLKLQRQLFFCMRQFCWGCPVLFVGELARTVEPQYSVDVQESAVFHLITLHHALSVGVIVVLQAILSLICDAVPLRFDPGVISQLYVPYCQSPSNSEPFFANSRPFLLPFLSQQVCVLKLLVVSVSRI